MTTVRNSTARRYAAIDLEPLRSHEPRPEPPGVLPVGAGARISEHARIRGARPLRGGHGLVRDRLRLLRRLLPADGQRFQRGTHSAMRAAAQHVLERRRALQGGIGLLRSARPVHRWPLRDPVARPVNPDRLPWPCSSVVDVRVRVAPSDLYKVPSPHPANARSLAARAGTIASFFASSLTLLTASRAAEPPAITLSRAPCVARTPADAAW